MRRSLLGLALLLAASTVTAQEPDYRDDLRFAEALRARGDNDLALELLRRLEKTASPALKKELSFELAKTALRDAAGMPEASRRLARYREARIDFQKFIADNPGHPRISEAYLDIARTLDLQGKTELNRAVLADGGDARKRLAASARALLAEAGERLDKAALEQEAALKKLPDPDAIDDPAKKRAAQLALFRAEAELQQTRLDRALNFYDQSRTFLGSEGDKEAIVLLASARKLLDRLTDGSPAQPMTWKARAWLGRLLFETEGPAPARERFQQVLRAASTPAAAEGVRLARYFRLLVIRAKPEPDEAKRVNSILIEAAVRWRDDYPQYRKTPEGFGLTFLLAQTYLAEADTGRDAARLRRQARDLLREVENNENEFTEQARRVKIDTMMKQGRFKLQIADLTTFEDCYVRAQYEVWMMGQDVEKAKDDKDADARRKARLDAALAALRRGLALPEAKKAPLDHPEVNNARAMLAFWSLSADRLDEAIAAGERFARDNPSASQAEMAAAYALRAYLQKLNGKLAKGEKADAERDGLMAFAGYMTQRWPAGGAGDQARHFMGLQLLREGRFAEAIKLLSLVGEDYADYVLACYALADAALKAERSGDDPIIGDSPGDYRKRAVEALERLPEAALGGPPMINAVVIAGKAMLGRELFALKRFAEIEELASRLEGRLAKLKFDADVRKDESLRKQLLSELVDLRLYAKYGQADAAEREGDHAKVAAVLDGLIDQLNRKEETPERANFTRDDRKLVARLTLRMALRANMQLGKIDRTDDVLDALDKVVGEGEGSILGELAALIRAQLDELRKRGDKAGEAAAVKGYAAVLDKRLKKAKALTPDFTRVLAACYSNMGKHAEAADLLGKVPAPGAKAAAKDEQQYRAVRLALVRELRLSATPDGVKKARALLGGILGDDKKPGWGRRDLGALMEEAHLLGAEGKWSESFAAWSNLQTTMRKRINQGGAALERYLECYYYSVAAYLRVGQGKPSQAERDKYARTAAQQIANLEASWPGFGSDASKKRFTELLAAQPAVKAAYEAIRKKEKKRG